MLGSYTKCCGCRACEQVCPTKAIIIQEDNEGFLRPHINENKCINCKLCEKHCDFNNEGQDLYSQPKKGYAAVAKDKKILDSSTSGGAFISICMAIEPEAIIYGCAYGDDLKVCHVRTEGVKNAGIFQKSKYVQSDVLDTYSMAKKDLDEGKTVIYSGTPCQIAGLKSFLRKNYERLYTIGLICHGIPSQKFFDSYINYLEKKNNMKITRYSFRERKLVLGETVKGIAFGNGEKRKFRSWGQDYFMNLYLKGKCYRADCYECVYANEQILRPEDITIGDCWNIEKQIPILNADKGVSTIIMNTKKAMSIVEPLGQYMDVYEVDVSILAKNNPNLTRPTKKCKERNEIYALLSKGNTFEEIVPKFVKRLGYSPLLKVGIGKIKKVIRRK